MFWLCNVSLQKCILFLFLFLFQKHWEGEDQASVSVSVSEADESWTQSKPGLVFTTKRSGLVFIYQDHSLFKERQEWLGKGLGKFWSTLEILEFVGVF